MFFVNFLIFSHKNVHVSFLVNFALRPDLLFFSVCDPVYETFATEVASYNSRTRASKKVFLKRYIGTSIKAHLRNGGCGRIEEGSQTLNLERSFGLALRVRSKNHSEILHCGADDESVRSNTIHSSFLVRMRNKLRLNYLDVTLVMPNNNV